MKNFNNWRRASQSALRVWPLALALSGSVALHAVVVRGHVRDSLNRPVASLNVMLVQKGQVVATARTGADGGYEIRAAAKGRFWIEAGSLGYATYQSKSFYGSELSTVSQSFALLPAVVHEQVSVTATGLPTPVAQVSAAVSQIDPAELQTRNDLVQELRMQPGVQVVQTGQNGGATSLFVRGANSSANKVLVDGVPANDIGGVFDFGSLSFKALDTIEVHRGPDSVLYGSDALASVVVLSTPRGNTTRPVLNYAGDAGNFHTWQNAVDGSGVYQKLDYFAALSRFDSSNALQMDRFHVVTSAANVGYAVSGATLLRGTVRHADSATGVPNAHDFYGISAAAKQADQNTFASGVLENTFNGNWHNLVRYYATRKREQYTQFYPAGELLDTPYGPEYFGNTVTIVGANGYSATGRAALAYTGTYPQKRYSVANRDGVQFQTDYRFTRHLAAIGGFRYEDERGRSQNIAYGTDVSVERRNYDYSLQFQGDFKGRVFYSLGGAVLKNYLYGVEGTPRLGIAWYPVQSGNGWLHGSKLHFNFSKGVQEPDLASQTGALKLYVPTAAPIGAQRARTYEGGIDQNIWGRMIVFHFNYFHNQFGRQIEYVGSYDILNYFGVGDPTKYYGAYVNSLDFKAQGIEAQLEWRTSRNFYAQAGYTYTDAVVQRSFSSDMTSVYGGYPVTNPNFPTIAIGSSSPLVGQRPFRRPPHLGYVLGRYERRKISVGVKAAFVSRADDSTFLSYLDVNGDNTLLLPNRNLDFAYQRVDADVRWQWSPRVGLYGQFNNLLGQQRMGPIGFPALPFNFRAGLRIRLGGGM